MPFFTPSFECRGAAARQHIGAALLGCILLTACAQPAAVPSSATAPPLKATAMTPPSAATTAATILAATAATTAHISAITLERDCTGCPTGTRLELHRDGRAVATSTGKARLRTADRVSRAALSAADFEALARQLLTSGYFEMAEVYEEAGLQDGSWATLTVVRDGVARQVFRREDAGPAALKTVEAAIAALQASLAFVPDAR